ncbi:MAG: hypothetical protein CM1200mP9_07380 [Gammaproteobacteria bacterium]|nr:MAG: hypothetical protein CM1200mP9_07380 [Gammaproteobacteria bacterium]
MPRDVRNGALDKGVRITIVVPNVDVVLERRFIRLTHRVGHPIDCSLAFPGANAKVG